MKKQFFSMLSAALLAAAFGSAHAGMTTDAHGNVGYDTAAECDAAVQNGTAKFYESFTHKKPLIRDGEKAVQSARIRDLGDEYQHGACDMGVGRKGGRDGVSLALQGKYVPFSPDMQINAYTDASGSVVRVTMQQCDNWFSGNAPRPVNFVKTAVGEPAAEKAPEPAVEAVPDTAPVVEKPAAVAPAAAVFSPYVFATIGSLHDGVKIDRTVTPGFKKDMNETDTRFTGQVGLGLQFNGIIGGEIYYQDGRSHYYSESLCVKNQTAGARLTLGRSMNDNNTRLFVKAGAAGVKHSKTWRLGEGKFVARPTAGVGVTHRLGDHLSVRADYDHYFQMSDAKKAENNGARWKGANYLGAGLQYNF